MQLTTQQQMESECSFLMAHKQQMDINKHIDWFG